MHEGVCHHSPVSVTRVCRHGPSSGPSGRFQDDIGVLHVRSRMLSARNRAHNDQGDRRVGARCCVCACCSVGLYLALLPEHGAARSSGAIPPCRRKSPRLPHRCGRPTWSALTRWCIPVRPMRGSGCATRSGPYWALGMWRSPGEPWATSLAVNGAMGSCPPSSPPSCMTPSIDPMNRRCCPWCGRPGWSNSGKPLAPSPRLGRALAYVRQQVQGGFYLSPVGCVRQLVRWLSSDPRRYPELHPGPVRRRPALRPPTAPASEQSGTCGGTGRVTVP